MLPAHTYGAANWIDLSTPDVAAATAFYRDLLGWTITHDRTPMGDYYIGTAGDLQVGGMMAAGPELAGAPSMWTVCFYVVDVDASAAVVTEAGGSILEPPFDIPDGRIAIAADPVGAVFALIAGPPMEGVWLTPTPGAVCWIELLTRDPAAAEAFYATVFGWTAETTDSSGMPYTTFSLDGETVAGSTLLPDLLPPEVPSYWSPYFAVADCAAAERRAAELGGTVLRPTADIGGMRFAVLSDPAGAVFQVLEEVATA